MPVVKTNNASLYDVLALKFVGEGAGKLIAPTGGDDTGSEIVKPGVPYKSVTVLTYPASYIIGDFGRVWIQAGKTGKPVRLNQQGQAWVPPAPGGICNEGLYVTADVILGVGVNVSGVELYVEFPTDEELEAAGLQGAR